MRIDSHQHYWQYCPKEYGWITDEMPLLKKDVLPSDIEDTLKKNNIDGVIAVQARQSSKENEFLLELADNYSWIKGVIGWVDLRDSALENNLTSFSHKKLKGFRHLIQDEKNPSDFFSDKDFNKGVHTILNKGYVYEVLFHEKDLSAAIDFCKRHDQHPLVIDHLGKPNIAETEVNDWQKRILKLAELPHVYCKLSGLITEASPNWSNEDIFPFVDAAIEAFTPGRLMFGSDWPVCQLAGSYQNVYEIIDSQIKKLTKSEQAQIMGNVACEIYQIKS